MLNERHLVVGVALLLFACGDGRLQRYGVSDAGPASDANVVTLPDGNTVPAVDAAGAQDSGELADAGVDVANAPDVEVEMGPVLRDGLAVEYFSNYHDSTGEQTEAKVDHDWGEGAPSGVSVNHFSARWEGFVEVPSAGEYTFWVSSDDGVRVWIDGDRVINSWVYRYPARDEATVTVAAGLVPVRIDYFEKDITAQMRFGWRRNGADEVLAAPTLKTYGLTSGTSSPKPPYQNPVVPRNCPDPGVVKAGPARYYMLCTGGKFPLWTSRDLVFWKKTGDVVLPDGKPAWADNGRRNWAPEIHKVKDRWIVYYTTVNANDVLSIGAAYSDKPTGPFIDRGSPLVQHPKGVIDANYFADDDGRHYLTYKIDGNAYGDPTPIYIRELKAGGLGFKDGSTAKQILVNNSATWEGGVVEAQWLVKRDGKYYLFYSGNVYDARYRTGVARATSVMGPYTKHGDPILRNNSRWVGPGHGSVVAIGEQDYFVYHAWPAAASGAEDRNQGRHVLLQRIEWENGWPKIGSGTPATGLLAWPQ